MVKLIDVHCHLDFDKIAEIKTELLEDFKNENIIAITNTLDFENYEKALDIYEGYENVFVIPGLYPKNAMEIDDDSFQKYLNYLRLNCDDFIAIGEVGLDLKYTEKDSCDFELQKNRFEKLIELAIEIDKPLIIHTRGAEKEVLDIIEKYVKSHNFNKFILHCFMGTVRTFRKIKLLKIYCSIPNILLTNELFQKLVFELSINQIFVETDSPYLHHKKEFPNTPLSIIQIYKEISKIKNIEENKVKEIIYNNFKNLFKTN